MAKYLKLKFGLAEYLTQAIQAFRAVRKIIAAAGVVKRVLRLFDALAVVDHSGLLAPVRQAVVSSHVEKNVVTSNEDL